jgi:hypothetical protein
MGNCNSRACFTSEKYNVPDGPLALPTNYTVLKEISTNAVNIGGHAPPWVGKRSRYTPATSRVIIP